MNLLPFEEYFKKRTLNERIDPNTYQTSTVDTYAGQAPTVSATTVDNDRTLRSDYTSLVSTFQNLKDPRVRKKMYDWIKGTFIKTPTPKNTQQNIAPDYGADMTNTAATNIPQHKGYGLSTMSSPQQMAGFKGNTTKIFNRN